jgi:hypothetical protein
MICNFLQDLLSLGAVLAPFLILLATFTIPPEPSQIPTCNPHPIMTQVLYCKAASFTHHQDSQTGIQRESSEHRYSTALAPEEEQLRQNMGEEAVKAQ